MATFEPALHPDIKKFTGIIPPDVDAKEVYAEYVLEKHKCLVSSRPSQGDLKGKHSM
jgi:hypothetical protein